MFIAVNLTNIYFYFCTLFITYILYSFKDTLKDINHKLREELQALDGEIEYMKYVNKAETKPTTKLTGKKR